ncbi:MAG: AMP-binding protein [Bacteroidetes bacterium]|nr:AMP-binding protein [Bacteroidota bacterium]
MKPWHKYYPGGKAPNIDFSYYKNLPDVLQKAVTQYGDSIACENFGKQLSFSELDRLSKDFAAFTTTIGLKKGDRIALQMPNILQYPIALFGSLRAGLVVVNTNPLYTPREMEHQFKDSGAKAVVILANFAHNLEKVLPDTEIVNVIVTELGDSIGGLKGKIMNLVINYVKKMVPKFKLPGHLKFNDAMKTGARFKNDYSDPEISSEDIAFLQYTGGTTGVSKGAMLTNANLTANLMQVDDILKQVIKPGEVTITPLPLYHIFALMFTLGFVKLGLNNVLITNPKDISGFVKELKKHKFTGIIGVNTLYNALLNNPEFKNIDFSALKLSAGGGMAIQKVVSDRWQEVTGVALLEGYGLTETSPVLTLNPPGGQNHRVGTIGIPIPETEIELMDEDGKPVPLGEPGEICARGPQVMKGYWQRQEATDEVMTGGWLHTGDIGIMDEDGFFKIVDRKKEMILVSGFNVYPNEIENVVASHPKVLEVGAIGVPDSRSTEVVKIFVVKRDQSLTKEELQAYCRENLTAYKCPRHIDFIDELPKSNVGKVLRRILKENDAKVSSYG